jgi:hypothetical protein
VHKNLARPVNQNTPFLQLSVQETKLKIDNVVGMTSN